MTFSIKEKRIIGILYAVYLILFYLIGIPGHKGFWSYVGGFLLLTALYAGGVWFVKKYLLK
jgi:hypothetical protein